MRGKTLTSLLIMCATGLLFWDWSIAEAETDRQKEHLLGSVQTVRMEAARLSKAAGQWVEEPRKLMVIMSYDRRGNRLEEIPGVTGISGLFGEISYGSGKTAY